jgi:RHS repeat-associated protein
MRFVSLPRLSLFLLMSLPVVLPEGVVAQVPTGDVVISANTAWAAGAYQLNSLTVNNGATLTVAGGSTVVVANAVTVTADANIVLQGANTTAQVNGAWAGTGVTISAANVDVDAGSSINADGQGYAPSAGPGAGPAGSSDGGSYGGMGGMGSYTNTPVAPVYGSATTPVDLGSGGGVRAAGGFAGNGGGALQLVVSGTLTNNGIISANGAVAVSWAGSGSGGSVSINAGTLTGSGSIAANGGSGGGEASGGGGRVAVYYATNNGFNLADIQANGGTTGGAGAAGTVEVLGANTNLTVSDNLVLPPNQNLTLTNLTINNGGSLTLGSGTTLTATQATISGGGTLIVGGGSNISVSGTLLVTGNSNVVLQGANTTAQVNGAWAGAGVTINAGAVEVDAGSSINADGQGYGPSAGPGGGPVNTSDGGSYGGVGGVGTYSTPAAPIYGSATAPVDLGSGGGVRAAGGTAGNGGGAVRLVVSGTLTNNGIISANGGTAAAYAGNGSGGSVYVTAGSLVGSGSFTANGGTGGEASGGGGRVAVYYGANSSFTGFSTSTASGGTTGTVGSTGTAVFFDTSVANTNLNLYQNFTLPAGTSLTYNAVTVQPGAVLTVGGGSQITVSTTLHVGGSVVLQSQNNTAQVNGAWAGSGVTITAPAIQVDAGGSINADSQGYVAGAGPGAGPAATSDGGSYGGVGGLGAYSTTPAAPAYGSAMMPVDLGSGGGVRFTGGVAGPGGGAMQLIVSGTLTDNGTISANGGNGVYYAGGGSGGSVSINAATLAGSGSILANGGSGGEAAGAGGRIALYFTTNSGFNLAQVTANTGTSGNAGAAGTVEVLGAGADLTVSDNLVLPPNQNLILTNLTINNGGSLTLGSGTTVTTATASVSAGGTMTIGGGSTMNVTGTLLVTGNSNIILQGLNATPLVPGLWNGAGVIINAASVEVDPGSSINADGQGYIAGAGPGGAPINTSDAGSYGGAGGEGPYTNIPPGATYGSATMPMDLGSGGGVRFTGGVGGLGGGAIRMFVTGTLTNNGIISANGTGGLYYGGSGSGGSVSVSAAVLAGSGTFNANGGSGGEAGGGGGRVHVYYGSDSNYSGIANSTVAGGTAGVPGSAGTIAFSNQPVYGWLKPSANVLHGTETLQWLVDTGVTVNITASGPLSETLASGLNAGSTFSWDTTTVPDGTYELRLIVLGAGGNTLQQVPRTVVVNNTVAWHSGVIATNQEWSAAQVQALDGPIFIPAGVTVTIDPGTIVKALPGAVIIVEAGGTLNAPGDTTDPVIFTTFDDSSVGGNTDFNAGQTVPTPGEWQGVTVQTGGQFNSNANTQFRYVAISLIGALASQTLQGSFVYDVSGVVVVPNGAALTIQPGAIVKFGLNAGITVQPGGQLIAKGTLSQPIYFTSINDDSVGGDTNGNGSATTPAPGDWGSILIDGATASFDHVYMSYGSGPASAAVTDVIGMIETTDNAVVTVADSTLSQAFWNGIQTGYPNGGGDTVTVTNTVMWGIEDRAINAWGGSTVHVVNSTFDGNTTGILAHGGAVDVENSIVSNSKSPTYGGIYYCAICGGTAPALSYNDVWTSVPGVPNYGPTDPTGTHGNISVNPVYVNEAQGDFRLNYGSPAIDAANGTVANYPLTDTLGDPRYSDPLVSNKTGIPDVSGSYPDMGAFEFVANAPSNIDFAVSAVTGPSTAMVDSQVQVNWTITNVGSGTAYGPWHDAVYLVRDPDTNPVQILAGQFLEGAGAILGPGATYSGTALVRVPGTVVGNHRWQVKTNVLGEVFEGQNTANNTSNSLDAVAVDLPELTLDAPALSGSFPGAGQSSWYKIVAGAGKSLSVNLGLTGAGSSSASSVQLFIASGYVPTAQHFDAQQTQWNSPSASAVIAATSTQTYYVTAYAQLLAASPAPFTISATTLGFSLNAVQPATAINGGNVTLTFVGGGFASGATFQLVGPGGTVYTANSVYIDDAAHANATFALNGVPTGSYTAEVTANGVTVTLANAVTVTANSCTGLCALEPPPPIQWDMETPNAMRAGFPAEVTLTYTNVSGIDQPAPPFYLTATGGTLTEIPPACSGCDPNFPQKYGNTFTSGLMLGINQTGPAGILPAGASGSLTFLATPAPGASSVNFSLSTTGAQLMGTRCGTVGGEVLPTCSVTPGALFGDAASLCQGYQPPDVNYLGFTRTCMQLLANLGYVYVQGPTVLGVPQSISQLGFSALVNLLSADATALSKQGTYEYDMSRLIMFELEKDGLQEFNQRYHLGAFGFGPSHAFDITASGGTGNGYPIMFYPDGTARPFSVPDPAHANQYLGTVGDYGVLTVNGDGTWQVTESNGVVYHFMIDPVASSNNRHLLDYIQDVNGNRTTVGYTNDLVTTVVDPLGNTLSFAYDSLGHITQSTDPEGRVTTYTYDTGTSSATNTPFAFLTSITNSSGTTSIAWNEGGPTGVGYFNDSCAQTYCEPAIGVSAITYPDGTHTYFTYDALGRLASQYRDGPSGALTYSYGSSGTETVTDALGNSTTTNLNEAGVPGQQVDPLGNLTQLSYDPETKLTGILAPLGASSFISYDNNSNLAGFTDPLGNLVSTSYTSYNNPLSLTDGNGSTTGFSYDAGYNIAAITHADGSTEQGTYDSKRNLLTRTNRRGHTITYTYNTQGLLASKTYANGTQAQYVYDNHRNLLSASSSAGTTTFSYDSADRLIGVSYPNGQSIQYSYNGGGQRISMTDSTGFAVRYSYDAAGRLAQLSNGSGSAIAAYTYDAASRLSRKTLGNGTYTTYTYDAAGNVSHVINYTPGNAILSEFDSTYDAEGRTTSVNSPAGAWTYGYDADGQVTSVTLPGGTVQYTYDAAGNRSGETMNGSALDFNANNLNEYTGAGASSYQYDEDGNLISGGGWTYAYDDDNRLISAVNSADTWTYQYDALGNRTSATHNGTVTQYLNDPSGLGSVEAEFNGSGQLIAHYTFGPDLASAVPASGTPAYYHFDAAGNTAQMTTSSGTVVNSYSYLPFGEKVTSVAGVSNPFTYVAQFGVMDEGSGLYFMRNRWYNPTLGRFNQTDPIGLTGDVNLYRYAANNPLTFVDPNGTKSLWDRFYDATYGDPSKKSESGADQAYALGSSALSALGGYTPAGSLKFNYSTGSVSNTQTLGSFGQNFVNGDRWQAAHDAVLGISRTVNLGLMKYPASGAALKKGGPLGALITVLQFAGTIDEASKVGFHTFFYYWYDPPNPFADPPNSSTSTPLVHSADPNGKLTVGYGNQGYIPQGAPVLYTICFENQPTATAPAQAVTVTDSLDPNLDWSTVQLNAIEFNNVSINVPGGLQSYTGQVGVSTDPDPVNINAALNPGTGVLTWSMRSVDPITGGTPQNPLAGFLPPNNASNQGTGFVTFTVYPKANLANGAVINNQASIVFDNNAPIATNSVMNTIDNTNPTSYVNTLPATTTSSSFPVSWTGTDPSGSGIAGYSIFVSVDGGAYSVWMASTPLTSATYTGAVGHSYSFYSLATNNVGNVQTTPGTAQAISIVSAVTDIVTPSAGTGGTISPSTAQTVNANSTTSFTVTPNSGYQIASVTGCGGTLSGTTFTTAPVTAACTVSATFSAITYTVTPSAGAGGTISPSTAQTVNANSTTSFTVTPNSGYQIASVTGCGGTLSGTTFTTAPVTAACTVSATFSAITYTVTPSTGAGGTISPSTAQTVNANSTTSFTVTPNSGYQIASVTGCGGTLSGTTFTTAPVTAACTVSATFSAITYTVTPSAGAGGTISPSTAQTVNANSTTSFTVTPNSSYQIASVTGCGGTLSGNTYKTAPVTASCTVSATFSPVTKTASITSITSSTPNPSAPGVAVLIGFKVTGGTGSPTGSVSVSASTGEFCTGVLSAGTGNCSITFASVGSRTLKASYPGDATFAGSVSSTVTQVVNGAGASVSPSSINFGNVYLGLLSAKTVTLTNSGATSLSIGKVQITGGNDAKEFVALSACPGTLPAGKSCGIAITFFADGANYNATSTLSITDNAPGGPQVVALSATVINPKATISTNSLSFGKQKVGSVSLAQSVKLTNTGTTPLAVSGLSVSGPFAIASGTTCANGTTLAANAGCVVTITFSPSAKGAATGALTIKDNALLSPQTVTLSGTGN